MASTRIFSFGTLLARLLASLLFVFSTYNPSGYSLYHWTVASDSGPLPLKLLVLALVAMLYYATLRAVFAAFRWSGLIAASLVAIVFSLLLVPVAVPEDPLSSWNTGLLVFKYVAPVSVALVIAFGLSWSHLIERLTGQLQKRYVR